MINDRLRFPVDWPFRSYFGANEIFSLKQMNELTSELQQFQLRDVFDNPQHLIRFTFFVSHTSFRHPERALNNYSFSLICICSIV